MLRNKVAAEIMEIARKMPARLMSAFQGKKAGRNSGSTWMAGAIDGNDVLILAGLALVGIGVGLWSVPAALGLVGAVLFGLGLMGTLRKAR